MAFSVNTNRGAMVALQSLNTTNKGLDQVQKRVSTGMNVSSTKDDSATYVTAQALRGRVSDLKAVNSSLSNAKSVVDVAVSGVEQISDVVNQMKTIAKQASDTTISATQLASYDKDFKGLRDQISTIVNASEFNGTNLLKTNDGAGGSVAAMQSLTNTGAAGAYAPDKLSIDNMKMSLATAADTTNATITTATTLDSAANAAKIVAALDKYLSDDSDSTKPSLNTKLSQLGTASRNIDSALAFSSKLNDTLESGIGNLVDADMAKESAKMQALQTKQQLGVQALSMANQGPSMIGQLFR